MEPETYPPVLSTSQAAEMLSLSVSHLRYLVRTGKIPSHRMVGGRKIHFLRDELIKWVSGLPSGEMKTEKERKRKKKAVTTARSVRASPARRNRPSR